MKMKVKCSSDDYSDSDGEHDPQSPSHSGGGLDRKRRRGIIEKRRRDRINLSLSELKRLVPSAFEKQGSAKLEKAEILQMTVDYLKTMQQKAGFYGDPATLAMDYRSIGYRECVAEVSRYLVTAEGLDIQDPLRIRLLSHLQYYGTQKEACVRNVVPSGGSGWHAPPSSQYVSSQPGAPFSAFEPHSAFTTPNYPTSFTQLLPPAGHNGQYQQPTTPQKPYRPWGSELGAFS